MVEIADRKVRMSPELMEQWATRDHEGYRLAWSWGEPDSEGFYTPTITRHGEDQLGVIDIDLLEGILADPAIFGRRFSHEARGIAVTIADVYNRTRRP